MKYLHTPILLLVLLAAIAACGPSQADIEATNTAIAIGVYQTQTAEAPTSTPPPTNTATPVPPTETPTPLPAAGINGRIYWTEGDKPIPVCFPMRNTATGAETPICSDPNGEFQVSDVSPGEYQVVVELAFTNKLFDPCSGMSFHGSSPGFSYSMIIRNGEMVAIKATSDPFTISKGETLDMEFAISFDCQ